jgi:endonuclease/exonuclease/phosphatase (EEP) superfamily protein YafD
MPTDQHGQPSRRSRHTRWRAALAWALLAGAALALLSGWLTPLHTTESAWLARWVWVAFMIRTFTFHAGLAVAGVAFYAAAFRLWKPAIACVPVLIITLAPAAWAYVRPRPAAISGPTLTLVSCNLLVGSGSEHRAAEYVLTLDPDVVFLQEYTPEAHAVLSERLGEKYRHIVTGPREDAFGQAVYSKLAPREVQLFPTPAKLARAENRQRASPSEPQIRCVVTFGGREVVLQNVHDMPPSNPALLQDQLRYFEWLDDFIASEARPVILAGDFNSTRNASAMIRLERAGYRNTHTLAGRGRGSTWLDKTWLRRLPGVRIDHVIVSRELACDHAEVGPSIGSDHRPIMARVGFR